MTTPNQPGWYDDPLDPNAQRYWDGNDWTPHRQRKPASGFGQPSMRPTQQRPGCAAQPAHMPAEPDPGQRRWCPRSATSASAPVCHATRAGAFAPPACHAHAANASAPAACHAPAAATPLWAPVLDAHPAGASASAPAGRLPAAATPAAAPARHAGAARASVPTSGHAAAPA